MMTIRQDQLSLLEKDVYRRFKQHMVDHLRRFAPRHAQAIGEPALLDVIGLGIRNAEEHGLTLRGPVRFYIEMMFLFGTYFDSDVQYPWAARALTAYPELPEMLRAGDLHQKALHYIQTVGGEGNRLLFDALRRLRTLANEPVPGSSENLIPELAARIERIYPDKCAYIGRDTLLELLSAGAKRANQMGMNSPLGQALFGLMTFELGHRFYDDPLYRWAGDIIRNFAAVDQHRGANKLREAALIYLDGALRNAPPEMRP
jgi:hypothetical protein